MKKVIIVSERLAATLQAQISAVWRGERTDVHTTLRSDHREHLDQHPAQVLDDSAIAEAVAQFLSTPLNLPTEEFLISRISVYLQSVVKDPDLQTSTYGKLHHELAEWLFEADQAPAETARRYELMVSLDIPLFPARFKEELRDKLIASEPLWQWHLDQEGSSQNNAMVQLLNEIGIRPDGLTLSHILANRHELASPWQMTLYQQILYLSAQASENKQAQLNGYLARHIVAETFSTQLGAVLAVANKLGVPFDLGLQQDTVPLGDSRPKAKQGPPLIGVSNGYVERVFAQLHDLGRPTEETLRQAAKLASQMKDSTPQTKQQPISSPVGKHVRQGGLILPEGRGLQVSSGLSLPNNNGLIQPTEEERVLLGQQVEPTGLELIQHSDPSHEDALAFLKARKQDIGKKLVVDQAQPLQWLDDYLSLHGIDSREQAPISILLLFADSKKLALLKASNTSAYLTLLWERVNDPTHFEQLDEAQKTTLGNLLAYLEEKIALESARDNARDNVLAPGSQPLWRALYLRVRERLRPEYTGFWQALYQRAQVEQDKHPAIVSLLAKDTERRAEVLHHLSQSPPTTKAEARALIQAILMLPWDAQAIIQKNYAWLGKLGFEFEGPVAEGQEQDAVIARFNEAFETTASGFRAKPEADQVEIETPPGQLANPQTLTEYRQEMERINTMLADNLQGVGGVHVSFDRAALQGRELLFAQVLKFWEAAFYRMGSYGSQLLLSSHVLPLPATVLTSNQLPVDRSMIRFDAKRVELRFMSIGGGELNVDKLYAKVGAMAAIINSVAEGAMDALPVFDWGEPWFLKKNMGQPDNELEVLKLARLLMPNDAEGQALFIHTLFTRGNQFKGVLNDEFSETSREEIPWKNFLSQDIETSSTIIKRLSTLASETKLEGLLWLSRLTPTFLQKVTVADWERIKQGEPEEIMNALGVLSSLDKGEPLAAEQEKASVNLLVSITQQRLFNNEPSLLLSAAQAGWKLGIALALEAGADVDLKEEDGYTVLMLAAQNGHTEVVQLLLDNGSDVNLKEEDGYTALIWAALKGHAEVVQLLLDNRAEVDLKKKHGSTALMWAAQNGHTEVVQLLLANGADVNLKNKHGYTALMLAAAYGYAEVVQLLLANGADVNLKKKHGYTALMRADNNGHTEIVDMIKEHLRRAAEPTAPPR